jgi:hypothetical protein
MNMQVLGKLLLVSCTLGGCASYSSEDVVVGQALQERDAAYIRLAMAITSYCSVSTETMDARQTCILERRFAAAQPENAPRMVPTVPSASEVRSAR